MTLKQKFLQRPFEHDLCSLQHYSISTMSQDFLAGIMTFQKEQSLKPRGIYISHLGPNISGFKQVKAIFPPPEFKFIMLHLFVCLLVYHSRMKDGPCGAENKPVCGLLQLLAERTKKELQRT